jgi:hypothetical protein
MLVIGLVVGDRTDQEQEEDQQDGAPALTVASDVRDSPPAHTT